MVGAGEVCGPTTAALIGAACSIGPTWPAAPVVGFKDDAPELPLLSASVGEEEKIVSPVSAGSARNEFGLAGVGGEVKAETVWGATGTTFGDVGAAADGGDGSEDGDARAEVGAMLRLEYEVDGAD